MILLGIFNVRLVCQSAVEMKRRHGQGLCLMTGTTYTNQDGWGENGDMTCSSFYLATTLAGSPFRYL